MTPETGRMALRMLSSAREMFYGDPATGSSLADVHRKLVDFPLFLFRRGSCMTMGGLWRIPLALLVLSPAAAESQAVDTIFVTVHDHRMALFVTRTTGDVVVLEAGGGSSHEVWNSVIPGLSAFSRVVAYDRPGYGLSDPCDSPRTAERIARELREALQAAGVTGPAGVAEPFLVAGWSFGGSVARVFAGNFPAEVRGLVLVDPAPETFYARAAGAFPDLWTLEEEDYVPALFADSTRKTEQREFAGFSASMEQARMSDARHDTPTVLLIAARDAEGPPDPISAMWIEELASWADRRPRTRSQLVPGAGHHIARDSPALVIAAVRELLATTRDP